MITKGLGTNSMFTLGYNKVQVVILFVKNNIKTFTLKTRTVQFKLKERLTEIILNSRLIEFFSKPERLITFFAGLRKNTFNVHSRNKKHTRTK